MAETSAGIFELVTVKAFESVPVLPSGLVTVTSYVPGDMVGTIADMIVDAITLDDAVTVPILTVAPETKPLPPIETTVPTAPEFGVTTVTVTEPLGVTVM